MSVSPSSPAWERTWSAFWDVLIAGRWDPAYGGRLCGDLRAAGLIDVHADYVAASKPGGSLAARLLSLSIERLRERPIGFGVDGEEIDDARRALEDPARTFSSQTTCVARGRRPSA